MALNTHAPEVLSELSSLLETAPEGMEEAESIAEESEENESIETEQNVEDDLEFDETEEEIDESKDEEETDEEEEETEESDEEDNLLGEEYFDEAFVEIDGDKVSLRDLKNGFLRQSDYTKKTTEIATQRKEIEQETIKARQDSNALLQDRFQMVALDVEKKLTQFNEVDWTSLARSNPNDYNALKAEYDVTVNEARVIESEYNKLKADQEASIASSQAETAQKSFETLKQSIPNWGKDVYTDLMEYAVESGMPKETVGTIVDAPAIEMMYKAFMFDKGKTELKNKVKPKTKASVKSKLKNKATKSGSSNESSTKRTKNIKAKLANTTNKNERRALNSALVADLLGDGK